MSQISSISDRNSGKQSFPDKNVVFDKYCPSWIIHSFDYVQVKMIKILSEDNEDK